MKKSILIILLFFIIRISVNADPAYPFPIEIKQPDGTSITIVMKGDEYGHWTETTDGYIITRNKEDIFEYAILKNGNIEPSGIKVNDRRTPSETRFIQSISKQPILNKIINEINASINESILSAEEPITRAVASATGTKKVLCILVGFSDLPFSKTNTDFSNLFNLPNYSANNAQGSVKDYFTEVSYGQVTMNTTVVGPYTLSNNMAYYGANTSGRGSDIRQNAFALDAIRLATANGVNLSNFDNDGDGYVDAVHIIYAGYSESSGGPANAIWPHQGQVVVSNNGTKTNRYACSSELDGNSGNGIATIGTICHELTHVLGAPDFYDRDYGSSGGEFSGTADWDIMARGSSNGFGRTPAHPNGYIKTVLFGWAPLKSTTENTLITMNPVNSSNDSYYKIPTSVTNEYFIVENRQQLGFDSGLPGHGMIIYHVHADIGAGGVTSYTSNINIGHPQKLYPLFAGATQNPTNNPNSYGYLYAGTTPFPGMSNKRIITNTSPPNLLAWSESPITVREIKGIAEANNKVYFVYNPKITGDSFVPCTGSNIFRSSHAATWTVPSGFQIVSGQGTNALTIRATSSSSNSGTLIANMALPDGTTLGLSKVISKGAPTVTSVTGPYTATVGYGVYFNAAPIFSEGDYEWDVSPSTASQSPWRHTNYITFNVPGDYVIGCRSVSNCSSPITYAMTYITVFGSYYSVASGGSKQLVISRDVEMAISSAASKQSTVKYELINQGTGVVVANGQMPIEGETLNFNHLPSDIYLLRIILDDNNIDTHRILLD